MFLGYPPRVTQGRGRGKVTYHGAHITRFTLLTSWTRQPLE